jgi:hypothetical protein
MLSRLPFTISKHVGFSRLAHSRASFEQKLEDACATSACVLHLAHLFIYWVRTRLDSLFAHSHMSLSSWSLANIHFQNSSFLPLSAKKKIRPSPHFSCALLCGYLSHPQVPHYEIALRLLDRLDRESSALLSRIDSDPAHQQRHQSRRVGSGDRAELDSSSSSSSSAMDYQDHNRDHYHAPHNCCFEHSFIESCRAQV